MNPTSSRHYVWQAFDKGLPAFIIDTGQHYESAGLRTGGIQNRRNNSLQPTD